MFFVKFPYICKVNPDAERNRTNNKRYVMNFIKTFLAAILAFVVGSFLVFFLWIFILLGIAGSMEKIGRASCRERV